MFALLLFKTNSLMFLLTFNYLHSSFYFFLLYFTEIIRNCNSRLWFNYLKNKNKAIFAPIFKESLFKNWSPLYGRIIYNCLYTCMFLCLPFFFDLGVSFFPESFFPLYWSISTNYFFGRDVTVCITVIWRSSTLFSFFLSKKTLLRYSHSSPA